MEKELNYSPLLSGFFFLRVVFFACNTVVCFQLHIDSLLRDIKCFGDELFLEAYRAS